MVSTMSFIVKFICSVASVCVVKGGFLDQKVSAWSELNVSLGCGDFHAVDLKTIGDILIPMWVTMPMNAQGQVEIRTLRYLAQRYFSHTSSLRLRGFGPSDMVTGSSWDVEELSRRVPDFGTSGLKINKFTLEDAVVYVAALQQVMFDAGGDVLDRVLLEQRKARDQSLEKQDLLKVLDKYILHWMGGDAFDGECFHPPGEQRNVCFEVPLKHELEGLVRAQVKALEFTRHYDLVKSGRSMMEQRFSPNDAHVIAGHITKNFAWFYESDCAHMKESLVALDVGRTGRIPLSIFYGASDYFGESEGYLDAQGVLDYSTQEAQVIIPNYLQAASNCIVATSQYQICCLNSCERVLEDIELEVKKPQATVEELLFVVGNMTDPSSLEEDEVVVGDELKQRLREVSVAHGGKVRLHSRLFAQWLHFVFPRECPFPHKSGSVSTASAMEYDGVVEIHRDDKIGIVAAANSSESWDQSVTTVDFMSQWDEEEEFLAEYSANGFNVKRDVVLFVGGLLLLLAGGIGFQRQKGEGGIFATTGARSHWV